MPPPANRIEVGDAGWRTVVDWGRWDCHVYPLDDVIAHDEGHACVCGPRTEMIPAYNGSFMPMFVHASLDGREADE